ncbi:MAG: SO_0444 family Cu/Zn efflux transporter [bacterium]
MEFISNFIHHFFCMFMDMSFFILFGLLCVGFLHVFINKDAILKHLGKKKFSSIVNASIVGVPLPLCSCGVVPTAIELKKSGASNGAVASFLTSTPQTGVDSIFATYSLMGPVMAIFRPIAAFFSGIITGTIVNIFAKNDSVISEDDKPKCCCYSKEELPKEESCCSKKKNTKEDKKIIQVFKYAFGDFLDEISLHFLLGMFIATLITTFIPTDFFMTYGLNSGIFAMICMILIGLPMYICSASSIPIVMSLISKGLSYGAGFAFLFAGPVTNIASIIVLNKSLGKKVTSLYLVSIIICSLFFGSILDLIINNDLLHIELAQNVSGHSDPSLLTIVSSIIFAVLILKGILKTKFNFMKQKSEI